MCFEELNQQLFNFMDYPQVGLGLTQLLKEPDLDDWKGTKLGARLVTAFQRGFPESIADDFNGRVFEIEDSVATLDSEL
jgi:hypothetical protein